MGSFGRATADRFVTSDGAIGPPVPSNRGAPARSVVDLENAWAPFYDDTSCSLARRSWAFRVRSRDPSRIAASPGRTIGFARRGELASLGARLGSVGAGELASLGAADWLRSGRRNWLRSAPGIGFVRRGRIGFGRRRGNWLRSAPGVAWSRPRGHVGIAPDPRRHGHADMTMPPGHCAERTQRFRGNAILPKTCVRTSPR